MVEADKKAQQENFIGILRRLGKMGSFFQLAAELSKESAQDHTRTFRFLMTQPGFAHLKDKIANRNFFPLITQLADRDYEHEQAGGALDATPSFQIKRLLDDAKISALLPRLLDKGDLRGVAVKLGENKDNLEGLVRRLAMEAEGDEFPARARQVAGGGNLGQAVKFISANPEVINFLADENKRQIISKLAEMDDDEFDKLVLDLTESQAVKEPGRRAEFFALVRGIGAEERSQKLASKSVFTQNFPEVADKLADDPGWTNLVRRMQEDENHRKVADMLKAGGDSAQVILSVADDPEFAEMVKRMCEDKANPNGFNTLVNRLRTSSDGNNGDHFFEQVQRLSEDDLYKEIHAALPDGPLTAEKLAHNLCELGKRLHEQQEFDRALTSFNLALKLDPTLQDAYRGHAMACNAKGFYSMAVEDYGTLIEKNDRDAGAYLGRGNTYLIADLLDEAEADFHKVLELSIDDDQRQEAQDGLARIARARG